MFLVSSSVADLELFDAEPNFYIDTNPDPNSKIRIRITETNGAILAIFYDVDLDPPCTVQYTACALSVQETICWCGVQLELSQWLN